MVCIDLAVCGGCHEHTEHGRDWYRDDEADAANQRRHDLDRDDFAVGDGAQALSGQREQQEERQCCTGVRQREGVDGGRDVIATDAQSRSVEVTAIQLGVGDPELADGGRLGDGDVVERTERTEDHAGEDEALEVDGPGPKTNEQRVPPTSSAAWQAGSDAAPAWDRPRGDRLPDRQLWWKRVIPPRC